MRVEGAGEGVGPLQHGSSVLHRFPHSLPRPACSILGLRSASHRCRCRGSLDSWFHPPPLCAPVCLSSWVVPDHGESLGPEIPWGHVEGMVEALGMLLSHAGRHGTLVGVKLQGRRPGCGCGTKRQPRTVCTGKATRSQKLQPWGELYTKS